MENRTLTEALEKITAQQRACKEGTAPWCVGEQLKDILRVQPDAAGLVSKDLDQKGMGLKDCEKKINDFARRHKEKGVGFCGPADSERIIREFYGLGAARKPDTAGAAPAAQPKKMSLLDFMEGGEADG